jgi:ABC-type polysaccharide/polyol phosphate export permease
MLKDKIKSIIGLSLSLAKANFKLRNEGSYLGIFWYLLEPLSFFIILLFLGGALSQNSIQNYAIYLFLGLTTLNFFMRVTTFSTNVIRSNSNFLKSMKVPQESFVVSGLLQYIFSHIFEVALLILFMIFFKAPLAGLIFYPIIFGFFCLFTLGLSFILATMGVYINDLNQVWSIIVRLIWFATPVFYAVKKDNLIHILNLYNPLSYFLSAIRDIVAYQRIPPAYILVITLAISLAFFFIGIFVFVKNKRRFAESL